MKQLLLFADPRPLVERLGAAFFRQAPESPGVYLMRGAADAVLYVGKAKSLRKRLASYRVANPERMQRRHLRLLRAVQRIELQPCADELAALERESELLRTLRPPFNRAGTWPGTPRYLAWRLSETGLELAIATELQPGWGSYGPMGAGALHLRAALVRLLWCALHPGRGLAAMPPGWFRGRRSQTVTIPYTDAERPALLESEARLRHLPEGDAAAFAQWIRTRTADQLGPFDSAVLQADLEALTSP